MLISRGESAFVLIHTFFACLINLVPDTILQSFPTERDATGLSISKEISYLETQKGIREGYGKCVLLNIHL